MLKKGIIKEYHPLIIQTLILSVLMVLVRTQLTILITLASRTKLNEKLTSSALLITH